MKKNIKKDKVPNFTKCLYCKGKGNSSNETYISICNSCKGAGYLKNPALYTCNMCGDSLLYGSYNEPYGLVDQVVGGGYGSKHLFDMTSYTFSLCEKCIRDMFNKFVNPPKTIDGHEEISFSSDQALYDYRNFCKSKEFDEKYLAGKCNYIIGCNNKAKYTIMENNGCLTRKSACATHSKAKIDRYDGKKMWESITKFVPEHVRLLR